MPLNSAEKIMKAVKFCNFTSEEFTWKHDGVPYTFAPGQEIFLEDYKAEHFAKHLVDREMNKIAMVDPKFRTDYKPKRDEFTAKCFPSDEVVTPLEALNIEENKKVKKVKKVEPEFEDLKVKKTK